MTQLVTISKQLIRFQIARIVSDFDCYDRYCGSHVAWVSDHCYETKELACKIAGILSRGSDGEETHVVFVAGGSPYGRTFYPESASTSHDGILPF